MLSSAQTETNDSTTILNNFEALCESSKEEFIANQINTNSSLYDSFGNTLQDCSSSNDDESCTFDENDSDGENSDVISSIGNFFYYIILYHKFNIY